MATDEWRVEVHLDDVEHGFPLSERLRATELDDEVVERLGERVIVTRDGPRLYVYTQTDEAAREAERVVSEVVAADELSAEIRRRRWNPTDRFWQDADQPLTSPTDPGTAVHEAGEDEGVRHPLFTFIEDHEPRFMRDLGI
ncbi:MAG: hypothetical protein ACRDK9_13435 [Solirubrobacterales bacterium]